VNALDAEFESAFSGSPEAFEAEYDFKVPSKTGGKIVVASSDAEDSRTSSACNILKWLGFSGVTIYEGGLADWQKRGGKVGLTGIKLQNIIFHIYAEVVGALHPSGYKKLKDPWTP
jgi:hypothetical protein